MPEVQRSLTAPLQEQLDRVRKKAPTRLTRDQWQAGKEERQQQQTRRSA
jgi:hypothetical protein